MGDDSRGAQRGDVKLQEPVSTARRTANTGLRSINSVSGKTHSATWRLGWPEVSRAPANRPEVVRPPKAMVRRPKPWG
jgi:hypothetical protein